MIDNVEMGREEDVQNKHGKSEGWVKMIEISHDGHFGGVGNVSVAGGQHSFSICTAPLQHLHS